MASYELLCFGSNGNGQLGVGHDEDLMLPQLSFQSDGVGIKKVSCGGNHSLLLLEDGSLYWCGDNSSGQCASSDIKISLEWIPIPGKFLDVACGWEVTIVIDEDGWVKTRGRGDKGELGVPRLKHSTEWLDLFRCENPKGSRCYATFQHCVVVVPEKIYGWGNNRKLQVCDVSALKIIEEPKVIYEGDTSGIEIALGKDFTCVLSRNENKLMIKGSLAKELPEVISRLSHDFGSITKIDSMWSSLHILIGERKLISIGRGSHGQFLEERLPSGTLDFVTGSEHGIVSTADMKVYCWGWGEHGNCGSLSKTKTNPINDKSNTISPLNMIGKYEKVVSIYGGCATTWFVLVT
ncbi:Ats1 [Kluyveromyces lactis]|nr:Ats1 [Kluyveromyces lactis]